MKFNRGDIVKVKGLKSFFEVVSTGVSFHVVTDNECESEWSVDTDSLTLVCKREFREDLK